jgi:uncharacterized protein (TIGR03437 family)
MRTSFVGKIALFASFMFACGANGQTFTFSLLPSGTTAPSPRFDGAIAYDEPGRQIFLFAGQDSSPRNDLWSYSLDRRQWAQVEASGTIPPARFGHTLLFDPVRRRLILFGGQAGAFFSDTWAFDIASANWRLLSGDDAGPSRRYGHSAIYETNRDRMVISHGFTDAGRFDDTWAFDLRTNSWANISPNSNRPLRRCLHHAVYDSANSRMYLYGGCSSGFGPCPQGDLWAFDLNRNQWTELTPSTAPPAREHYGMAFDATRDRLVVFGGAGPGLLNDTWEYDSRSTRWQQTPIDGTLPSARQRHETAYISDRGTVVFFGGTTSAGLSNELWTLSPSFAPVGPQLSDSKIVNAFSYQSGGVAPGEIVSIFGGGLGPRNGIAFAFDPSTGTLPVSGPGIQVTWNGIPAPLYFAREDQLNVQVPYELNGATQVTLSVTVNGSANSLANIPVVATAPGLAAVAFNADLTLNAPSNPAAKGSLIVIFATGEGITVPASRTGAYSTNGSVELALPVSLSIGGLPSEIVFRGRVSGTAGVLQINARVPDAAAAGERLPVVTSIGDRPSPPINIAVK